VQLTLLTKTPVMKKITQTLLAFTIAVLSVLNISAQTAFEVPVDYQLNVKEDYPKYEADIIAAANWLESNDLNKESQKRKEVSAFVIKWITGSPYVTVSLTEQVSKLYGKNSSLLIIYMASYTKHYLENKTSATQFSGTKAALISMMNVYKKGIEISKTKEMEKLIKLTEENKLDEYITEKFK
jgi:hypothetical protein